MYALYYYPGNASLLPHMMLREIGVPFELRLVDREANAHRHPDYLRLNPNGRIPVLLDDGLVLYETAAIALHLVDRHPEAELGPRISSSDRAPFYKWMIHLTNTPQVDYLSWFYPDRYVSDPAMAPEVQRAAAARLEEDFERIALQLGDGPWLLGSRFSAADLFLFMLIRWGRAMPKPPRIRPPLAALAARVLARPAVQAALDAERIAEPFF